MLELFANASKLKLRFDTRQGSLATEDLWELPLTTVRANVTSLNDLAKALNRTLKESDTEDFVGVADKTNETVKLKFDIVLKVIEVKKEENALAELKVKNAKQRDKILEIIDRKEGQALEDKPIEELRAILNSQ